LNFRFIQKGIGILSYLAIGVPSLYLARYDVTAFPQYSLLAENCQHSGGFSSEDGGRHFPRREAIRRFNLNQLVQHKIRVFPFTQIPQHRFDTLPLLLT
jgi:hypothetical protein